MRTDAGLGASDCEAVREGVLAQPIATLSSLAFVGTGLWLATRLPDTGRARAGAATYAGLVTLVGLGSVAYHGPQLPGAELAHDLPILLVLVQGAAVPLARRVRRQPAFAPDARRAVQVAAMALAGGAAAYALGRTGSPACDPESWLQPHAAWHVAMAVGLGAWGVALWRP